MVDVQDKVRKRLKRERAMKKSPHAFKGDELRDHVKTIKEVAKKELDVKEVNGRDNETYDMAVHQFPADKLPSSASGKEGQLSDFGIHI